VTDAPGRDDEPADDRLTPLGPAAAPRTARDVVSALRLRDPRLTAERPRVVAAMVASADGRAQLTDRSVGLGNAADRALLRELRTGADAVLSGARTLAAERYANLLDEDQVAHRKADGHAPHPVVATVSRNLDIPVGEIPLFAESGVPIVVYTEAAGDLGRPGADLEVRRLPAVTPGALLDDLHRRHGVRAVSCEGGPALLRALLGEARLDVLMLTLAPKLVAGDALTTLSGERFGDAGLDLRLEDVLRAEDHLFLHYVPVP
jgi:riboflavin biosynthesis pyrimidine reductase